MGIHEDYKALKKEADKESAAIRKRFVKKNVGMLDAIMDKGIQLEYVKDYDHLFVTFGEPREGIAIFAGRLVALADPDTLELVGMEVLNFKKAVNSGTIGDGWARLLSFVEWQPIFQIPPSSSIVASDDEDDLPHDLARVVERELIPA